MNLIYRMNCHYFDCAQVHGFLYDFVIVMEPKESCVDWLVERPSVVLEKDKTSRVSHCTLHSSHSQSQRSLAHFLALGGEAYRVTFREELLQYLIARLQGLFQLLFGFV